MGLNILFSMFSAFEFTDHFKIISIIQVAVYVALLATNFNDNVEKAILHLNTPKDYLSL